MENSIFRQKSIDRISSPEEFDEYVKVASPGLWVFLGGIVIFLLGVFVWAQFGSLDTTVNCSVLSRGDEIFVYIDEVDIGSIEPQMPVHVDGKTLKIKSVPNTPSYVTADEAAGIIHMMSSDKDDLWAYECEAEGDLDVGLYYGEVVVESVKPMQFIID